METIEYQECCQTEDSDSGHEISPPKVRDSQRTIKQPRRQSITCLLNKAKKEANRYNWAVLVVQCDNFIEVHYDTCKLKSEETEGNPKDYICQALGLSGNKESVRLFKVLKSEMKEYANFCNGDMISSMHQMRIAAGAFCTVRGKKHILTVSHGRLKTGDHVTSATMPLSFCGVVRAHVHRLTPEICDVALISLNQMEEELELSNTISGHGTDELRLRLHNGLGLQGKTCYLFQSDTSDICGIVQDMKFDYRFERHLSWIRDAIAITRPPGQIEPFADEGDSGKIVFVKQRDRPDEAQGFGIVFGKVSLTVVDENHQQQMKFYTILTPLERAIDLLKKHEYCSGDLLIL